MPPSDGVLDASVPPAPVHVPPLAAYDLVTQLRTCVHAMRVAPAARLHALAPAAEQLGLGDPQSPDGAAPRVAPEAWNGAMCALHTSLSAFRHTLEQLRAEASSSREADQRTVALVRDLSVQNRALSDATASVPLRTWGTSHALPPPLWTGALRDPSSPPLANRPAALAALDALCSAMAQLAAALHLESFQEQLEEAPLRGDAPARTHTFTAGGKILVLDLELALGTAAGAGGEVYVPHVALKLSYAREDASQGSASGSSGDTRLADMLRAYLRQLANALFGHPLSTGAAPSDPTWAHAAPDNEPLYTRAVRLWERVTHALSVLAYTDDLCAQTHAAPAGDAGAPTPRVDLFASLESLTTAVEQVCASEAVAAERSSQNDAPSLRETLGKPGVLPALLRAGHGVALAHVHAPYLCVAFHMPAAALQRPDEALAAMLGDVEAPSARQAYTVAVRASPTALLHRVRGAQSKTASWAPLSGALDPGLGQRLDDTLHAECTRPLGPLAGGAGDARRRVAYVAEFSPPLVAPRRVARALLDTVCVREEQQVGAPREARATTYVLERIGANPRDAAETCDFAPALDDLSADEETCEISTIPFESAAQLFALLEVARDQARVDELLTSAPRSGGAASAPRTGALHVTVRLDRRGGESGRGASPAGASIVRMSFIASPAAAQTAAASPGLVNVAIAADAQQASGWAVQVEVAPTAPGENNAPRALHANEPLAQSLGDTLASTGALAAIVPTINQWACGAPTGAA